jgi:hypothetical protein
MQKRLSLLLLVFCLIASGCIKRYRSTEKETVIDFATGIDFGFSASGTDTLDNRKGISPGEFSSEKSKN